MFDFRYHALSLVAVFVALTVGLLLGVAIGDEGLVSSAEQNLRADLRGDVREARARVEAVEAELTRRQRYEEQTLGRLVAERLDGRRVSVVFLDERSEAIFDRVDEAVRRAGGEVRLVGTLTRPVDLQSIADAAAGTRYEELPDDPSLLDDLGRRLGVQLVRGGRLLSEVRRELLSASTGDVGPAEAVLVVRTPGNRLAREQQERADALAAGLIAGAESAGAPVVGVEESTTDPSQVPWYRDRRISSVDNVDQPSGRASLVYVLAGAAEGAFGIKPTRDAYLPDALVRTP